jgi:hypothetical protein
MDGQGRARRSRGEPSPRSSGSSRGPGARDAAASGSRPRTRNRIGRRADVRIPAAGLQATYRLLQTRGLEATEAANLTAWMTGLPVREHRWGIREVQTLVFLRRLMEQGRFGSTDGLLH